MIFVDFIASISERVSEHRGEAAPVAADQTSLDPTVGLASIDVTPSGDALTRAIDGADVLRHLEAPVIGIVGLNAVAEAIAAYARAALGTEIVHCRAAGTSADLATDAGQRDGGGDSPGVTKVARYVRREDAVQMTDVFCFALPWTREAGDWLRWYRSRPAGEHRTLVVAGRRSAAVDRTLAYVG